MSHLFAYFFRMRFIRRWGLMHNNYPENVQEHTQRVALIAHSLALVRNRFFGGSVDADRTAALALYHDAGEVLTGDLPSPVKYFNPEIRDAYKRIEDHVAQRLLQLVPEDLRADYRPFFFPRAEDAAHWQLVKAADKLCAYIKCLEEVSAGNREFTKAEKALRQQVEALGLAEVDYYVEHFVPSFRLTLDELG